MDKSSSHVQAAGFRRKRPRKLGRPRVLLVLLLIAIALPWVRPAYATPTLGPLSSSPLQLPRGDVDGDGDVDVEDARLLTRYVTGEFSVLPHPENADATQDGSLGVDDALAIAQRAAGRSRFVVASPEYGLPGTAYAGSLIRVEVAEHFFPFDVSGGTVRITSSSTGYDSGDQPLVFDRSGRALYYHWDTSGLPPAPDYQIYAALVEAETSEGQAVRSGEGLQDAAQPQATLPLISRPFEVPQLAQAQDAYAPAPGIALEFRRVYPQDSAHVPIGSCGTRLVVAGGAVPWCSPLGSGWMHTYDVHLEEFTDGRIAFVGPNGFNRWFQSNADGTHTASPGDHGGLTRDPGGTFQLQEKDGFIYRFRSDLRLDYVQDTNGNRVSAVYDGSGRLAEIRHSCGEAFFLEYNAAGLVVHLTDHAGRVTTYEYDPTNSVLTKVVDPAGNATVYTYGELSGLGGDLLPAPGRLVAVAFPDGTHAHYEYDAAGRLVRQTGTWGANPISSTYDEDGTTRITDAVTATITTRVNERGQPVAITDPDGGQTRMQYDTSANLTAITDPLARVTRFGYDGVGNVVTIINPLSQTVQCAYDPQFNKPASIIDPLGHTTHFYYDAYGNLLRTAYPDTSQETYIYDPVGNLTSFTDTLSHTTTYTYNVQGLMTSLEDALGSVTQLSYDAAGDMEAVTDANGHATSYTRDTLGRVTRVTYPSGSHEDYEYNAMGQLTAVTNQRGERVSFSYDVAGRLEWKTYPDGERLHFRYDNRGVASSIEAVTGTQPITTPVAYYEYDLSRRLTLAKVPGRAAPESYDVSSAYDGAGNRRYLAYPDGYSLAYQYDAVNRLIRIADAGDHTIVAYQYDAAGRRTRRTLGNGTYTSYEYDVLDRLTKLVNYAPDDTVQSQFEYTYNAADTRTAMTTLEGTHRYTYDDLYQLTGVEYPDGRTVEYAFDAVGNRTVVTDTGVLTDYVTNALDQYTQVGTDALGYDANGNLVTRSLGGDVVTYGWDEDDRLVSVDRGGTHIDYRYDHERRLVAKTMGGEEGRYIWDGQHLIAEMDAAGRLTKRYIYGAGINEVIVVNADGTPYWAQQDGLGSVVGTTNNSGAVVTHSSYDVYGNVRSGDLSPVPQRFAGMWWDQDAGIYYVQSRWYDSRLGRFISTDPLKPAGEHQYAYTVNDPVNRIDQNGQEPSAGSIKFRPLGIPVVGQLLYWTMRIATGGLTGYPFVHMQLFESSTGTSIGVINNGPKWQLGADRASNYYESYQLHVSEGVFHRALRETVMEYTMRSREVNYNVWGSWFGIRNVVNCHDFIVSFLWNLVKNVFSGNHGGSGGGGSGGGGGGVCPTFVQLPPSIQTGPGITYLDVSQEQLAAKITVPIEGALLRADIPIFGVAGGTDLAEYRVEYGEGRNPAEWHLIASSTTPQPTTGVGLAEIPLMQGDVDIRGNLATWNTGLKNWVHLPWHPAEDPTDLNGVYTLRLVVTGQDGQVVEDRLTVEVGRAIAQALPGIARSPDGRAVMRFPGQSLTYPFRVYSILPLSDVGQAAPAVPEGTQAIGPVYRVREPGDRFIKDVALDISAGAEELAGRDGRQVGIVQYDAQEQAWRWLTTTYAQADGGATFTAMLSELPTPQAVYALLFDPNSAERSRARAEETPEPEPLVPVRAGVLIDDTFEAGRDSWRPRDRFVGATVTRDRAATPDGSYALKVANESYGGNFSVTVVDRPFDARAYPVMSFDYRIPPGVKTDFYLRVNGRWYNLGFTDDAIDFRNRDVNIGNLGRIEGIAADDRWHSASVNLYRLLGQKTRHTQVDAIIMADWDVGGYMKLEFGRNARRATYYIDNFTIAAAPAGVASGTWPVDTFDTGKAANLVGGPSGTFSNPGKDYCQATVADDTPAPAGETTAGKRSGVLRLTFDTSREGAYCGYWTALMAANVEGMDELALRLRAEHVPAMLVGLRHAGTGTEAKVPIQPYVTAADHTGWRTVTVPLSVFLERGLPDLAVMDTLFVTFENSLASGKGTLLLDDLQFQKEAASADAADPDRGLAGYSFLPGGTFRTVENGAAAISVGYHQDRTDAPAKATDAVRISYGGTIGLGYGGGEFSYAIWETDLSGIDARRFQSLVLKLRGEKGGEKANIYLDDGTTRRPVRAKDLPALTTSWQEISLPLENFSAQGVDLSHLETLQLVFEWEDMSGTIYVADIHFEGTASRFRVHPGRIAG